MREFKTAAKKKTEADRMEVKLDGEILTSVRPNENLMVFIMAAQGSETRSQDSRMADMIDGVMQLFDEPSRRYLKGRLLDADDPLEFMAEDDEDFDLMELAMGVIEEWSNRPTKPSSDSTSPSEDSGTDSTVSASPKELISST